MFAKLWVPFIFSYLWKNFDFRFALLAVAFAVFTSTQAQVPVVPAVAAAYAYSPYYYYPWAYPTVAVWGSDKVTLFLSLRYWLSFCYHSRETRPHPHQPAAHLSSTTWRTTEQFETNHLRENHKWHPIFFHKTSSLFVNARIKHSFLFKLIVLNLQYSNPIGSLNLFINFK